MAFKIIVCAKQVPDTNVIKINPKTGTLTLSPVNMLIPLRASAKATSCGVLTTTAPVIASVCTIVKWISLVPGGKSIKK